MILMQDSLAPASFVSGKCKPNQANSFISTTPDDIVVRYAENPASAVLRMHA